jgi:hypothetical protein
MAYGGAKNGPPLRAYAVGAVLKLSFRFDGDGGRRNFDDGEMWISIAVIMPATRRRWVQCIKSSGRDISRRTRLISQNKISSEIVEFERHSLWMSRFYHPYLQHVRATRHAFKAGLGFFAQYFRAEFT